MTKQEEWISAAGCVYNIYYHFVWCTKYRRQVLTGEVATYLQRLHKEIADDRGLILREQVVNPDHVHLFITAHPKFSLSQIVKIFKGITAKLLFAEFPYLRGELWKGHLWNPSYYCGTCGEVTKETIRMYIERQKVK